MEEERKLGVKDESVTQPLISHFCEISILLEVSLEKFCMKHIFLCMHLRHYFVLFSHLNTCFLLQAQYIVSVKTAAAGLLVVSAFRHLCGEKILHLRKCAV